MAISLVGNPQVVFLDEPSSGLDPSHRRQMWNILLSKNYFIFRMQKENIYSIDNPPHGGSRSAL